MTSRLKEFFIKRPVFSGLTGFLSMILFFAVVLSVSNSVKHFLNELTGFWYLILPLSMLFGFQIGMFSYMVGKARIKTGAVAASGGVSAGSMVMCCLHHVFEALPILGLAGVSVALAGFQENFLLIGNLTASVGTFWMLKTMQEHTLYSEESFWKHIMSVDWKVFTYTFGFFAVVGITLLISRVIGGLI